ncbi:uncharacterized protein ACN427_007126 isoform 1-T6 [Glossina fuscipes fuscipes]
MINIGSSARKMSFLMDSSSTSTNLYHQLSQRENNIKSQNQPRTFTSHLYRERLRVAKNLYKTDLIGHYGCVNAIEFSHGGQFLASGGDDKRVLIWNIERSLAGIGRPRALDTEHASNIFCLGFDSQNHKLISGGNDDLVISHDFETGKLDNVFKQDNPVYGLSIDPQNDSIFATASENGKVLLFDQRADPTDPFVVADLRSSFHAVEFHPAGGNLLITANSKHGAALYDIRKPNQAVMRYRHFKDPPTCMSVRFNRTGNLILALRRRLPPILYRLHSSDPTCTFYHKNYYNSCTMKSCTFAGEDDELVLSGSDDFNLYVWRLSDIDLEKTDQWVETAQMVLFGHRSIVNQVRYNRQKCLLASSGVEKIVKIWSPFSQHNWSGSLLEEATCSDNPREIFSPFFVNVMTVSSLSHDYSSRNTNEDPRMLAFFDSLIRQEIDGLESNISTDSSIETETGSSSNLSLDSSSSSSSSSDSSSTSTDSDGDDGNNDNNQVKAVVATGGGATATPTTQRTNSNSKRIIRRRLITRRRVQRIKRSHFENMKHIFKIRQPKQQHKKRIGYLIPKSSRTLRLLALEGGALSHNRYHMANQPRRLQRGHGHGLLRLKNNDKPTTSSAAAATISASSSSHKKKNQKRKTKVQKYIDSTVSSEENSATTNTLRALSNNTQAVVPSTSTGITTSLRDDILRLRRQQQLIFESDEDDDDDDETTASTSESRSDRLPHPTKKLNGLQRGSSNVTTTTAAHRSLRTYQGPKHSAALNIDSTHHLNINTTTTTTTTATTMLPQQTNPTTPHSDQHNIQQSHNSSSSSNNNNNNNNSNSNNNNSNRRHHETAERIASNCGNRIPKKRRRTNASANANEFPDNYSSNSRLSNSSYPSDFYNHTTEQASSTSSDTTTNNCNKREKDSSKPTTSLSLSLTKPGKRRQLSIADYINKRQHYENGPNSDENDNYGAALEENNNEQNNNDIFVNDHSSQFNGQQTPPRTGLTNSRGLTTTTNGTTNSLPNNALFTPDSGISLNNSNTPITSGLFLSNYHNDTMASTSRASTRLSPCLQVNDFDSNDKSGTNYDDEGVVVNRTNNNGNSNSQNTTRVNAFQQKVSRIRRNYAKQFAGDDSESD